MLASEFYLFHLTLLCQSDIDGKELLTIIFGTILCLSTLTGVLSPSNSLIYLASFRIIIGIGIGGDIPMSSSITADRTEPWKRGTVLWYIVSMQGWSSLVGSLVTIVVLAAYKHPIHDNGEINKLDVVWRIMMGFSLVPAFATVYQQLTLPEPPLHSAARRKYIDRVDLLLNGTNATRELPSEPEEKLETDINVSNVPKPAHTRGILGILVGGGPTGSISSGRASASSSPTLRAPHPPRLDIFEQLAFRPRL